MVLARRSRPAGSRWLAAADQGRLALEPDGKRANPGLPRTRWPLGPGPCGGLQAPPCSTAPQRVVDADRIEGHAGSADQECPALPCGPTKRAAQPWRLACGHQASSRRSFCQRACGSQREDPLPPRPAGLAAGPPPDPGGSLRQYPRSNDPAGIVPPAQGSSQKAVWQARWPPTGRRRGRPQQVVAEPPAGQVPRNGQAHHATGAIGEGRAQIGPTTGTGPPMPVDRLQAAAAWPDPNQPRQRSAPGR